MTEIVIDDKKKIRDEIVERYNKDRIIERETTAIINYYKIVFYAKLTFNNTDEFKIVGGNNAVSRLESDIDDGYISLDSTNEELSNKFKNNLVYMNNNPFSMSPTLQDELSSDSWLPKSLENCFPEVTARDTLEACVYGEVIKPLFDKKRKRHINDSFVTSELR